MDQRCKVCSEPAAGFHFGAFTCEGCKSFFGRTYQNVSSLNDCKNGGLCVITKKTRTACKSCRLRKCLSVGMSKSGSRYGRRSNWFKIHFLLQNNPNNDNNNNNSNVFRNVNNCELPVSVSSVHSESWKTINNHSLRPNRTANEFLLISGSANGMPVPQKCFPSSNVKQDASVIPPEIQLSKLIKCPLQVNNSGDCRKELESPSAVSSDSLSSDYSVKENGDHALISGYTSNSIYPKDLLNLYSASPHLGSHLPPYANPATLASKLLFPYYPSLFSLYSDSHYMKSLINNAKELQSENESAFIAQEENKNASPDLQPPLKMFKKSLSPLPSDSLPTISSKLSTDFQTAFSSTTAPLIQSNSASLKFENGLTATNEISPIDLSVKTKYNEVDKNLEKKEIKLTIKNEHLFKEKTSKFDQHLPLDLSSFKMK